VRSKDAQDTYSKDYRGSGVPLNCIIDREEKVVASFYGYRRNDPRVKAALAKLGLS
jgi:hypothetical protein